MSDVLTAENDIRKALVRYARALDTRDWGLLDTVFAPELEAQYGDQPASQGRNTVVDGIRGFLDRCGPSQHLMGNFDVTVNGTGATSVCYIRVFHQGKGDRAPLTQETFGSYHATWTRTAEGWRAVKWRLAVSMELGTREAFGF
ncbi:MAG: nuclear transport factor 2 family protein [Rhodospirillaceae bacterium]|nr:nuclear transport factor 2 family protein [Rhodospirillaceae bacterium]